MFTSEQIKSAIVGLLLTILGGTAAKLGLDAATTSALVSGIAAAVVAGIMIIWRVASKSDNKIIAAAAGIIKDEGGVIQTTPDRAAAIPAQNVVAK